MKLVKVAAAVLNQTPMDWEGNKAHILSAIAVARPEGASVLCLPELCITGYGCEDAFHSAGTHKMAVKTLLELVPATKGMIVSFGLPLLHQNGLFNVACLAVDGQIKGFVAKRFLAGDGIHYEPRWFKAWPQGLRGEVVIDDVPCPIGDICFNCGGVKMGFEICEDAWVANRPGASLALQGVDIILNPSASHFAFGKIEIRKRFVLEGSRAFGASYVYANLLGNEAGRAIYDGGALIASGGKLIAAGPRFSFADYQVTSAVIDVEASRMSQARTASFKPALDHSAGECVTAAFSFPQLEPTCSPVAQSAWETAPDVKEEEFARAIALGLYDYLRKSRSHGFVVSLSGGADSAAVSCLVSLMVRLGVGELGFTVFLQKLQYVAPAKTVSNESQLLRSLLTCAYQASANSSMTTRNAAHEVAVALQAEFLEFNVSSLVNQYEGLVSDAIGRKLCWSDDDLALQNIQARVRGPSVWLLANLKNALLLSTSNRSEAAVGYATMDGDTCGGLSPIAGIDKAFLRQWLVWLEKKGPCGLGSIPALAAVNRQAPTAELRPSEAGQTDEDDLMPYLVLDAIERAAIRDKKTPLEVYLVMRAQFQQYRTDQLFTWVNRFFRLWCRNQWKRERYAPSFHLDDENLDPRSWCRFPILSGGYEVELLELREYVERESKAQKRGLNPDQELASLAVIG